MVVFRIDPCGFVCIFITYIAILYADYVVTHWIVLHTMTESLWGAIHVLIFNVIVFLASMSHIRAVFSDPGVVPIPHNKMDFSDFHSGSDQDNDWTVCNRCDMYRPPRAHHCRICKRCIRKMDHHCPWINNCVGEWNQKFFLQFLFFIGCMAAYSLSLIAYSWLKECKLCSKEIMVIQTRMMHSVILSMESILFGLFVTAILCDQLSSVFSDQTAVEHVKKEDSHRPHQPKMVMLREVCGNSHPMLWIFPCTNAAHPRIEPYSIPI